MLTVQTENVAAVAQGVSLLAKAHWDEVEASLYGEQVYAPDINTYALLEKENMLHICTVRDAQGLLCGYAVFVLSFCHHKQRLFCASLDALYVAPAMREGFAGLRLLRYAEKALQARGVQRIQYSSPTSRPCDALYRRLGAKHTESLYFKMLTDC